eukprot:CAMPEP_0119318674 /NCGR_PEP_ID=MMETSP1333-20130426/47158_1 /TAXON_ID=418940 /ORGANISM="Scyphosphaera apsteinii, Strain RCC1455" /LENGTH=314 /DNA_ID=CAMNT_0007324905 /DNA_START=108 /DNA_END=1052 /DNA_ORIENTATION=+
MWTGFQWLGHCSTAVPGACTLTYLEINGWLITAAGVTVLCDPVLEGSLDFGIPDIYSASKRVLPATGVLQSLPPLDALILTQGLDDHAHERTLSKLGKLDPFLPVIAPPSAKAVVGRHFHHVTYLTSTSRRIDLPYLGLNALPTIRLPSVSDKDSAVTIRPRQTTESSCAALSVQATSGALVGPPWQLRENGYVIRPTQPGISPSIYLEPHVEFDSAELANIAPVDIVITPVCGQGLPGFELVHGPGASVELVKNLGPRWVLPMANGAINARGLAAPFISEIGSRDEFERSLQREKIQTEVLRVQPAVPLTLAL